MRINKNLLERKMNAVTKESEIFIWEKKWWGCVFMHVKFTLMPRFILIQGSERFQYLWIMGKNKKKVTQKRRYSVKVIIDICELDHLCTVIGRTWLFFTRHMAAEQWLIPRNYCNNPMIHAQTDRIITELTITSRHSGSASFLGFMWSTSDWFKSVRLSAARKVISTPLSPSTS